MLDLVELLVGRPPRRTEALLAVAPGTGGEKAIQEPSHRASLSIVHHALRNAAPAPISVSGVGL
jgi:hypothetical protein